MQQQLLELKYYLINFIKNYKNTGVVICGPNFPTNKLTFTTDFHIHIKVSKQILIEVFSLFVDWIKKIWSESSKYVLNIRDSNESHNYSCSIG